MANVKPFRAIRPSSALAAQVAALPYDVYNREEAAEKVKGHPLSFLNIDRPETQFDPSMDMYADCVYEKAKEMLDREIAEGVFVQDEQKCYYLYELTMNGRRVLRSSDITATNINKKFSILLFSFPSPGFVLDFEFCRIKDRILAFLLLLFVILQYSRRFRRQQRNGDNVGPGHKSITDITHGPDSVRIDQCAEK